MERSTKTSLANNNPGLFVIINVIILYLQNNPRINNNNKLCRSNVR